MAAVSVCITISVPTVAALAPGILPSSPTSGRNDSSSVTPARAYGCGKFITRLLAVTWAGSTSAAERRLLAV